MRRRNGIHAGCSPEAKATVRARICRGGAWCLFVLPVVLAFVPGLKAQQTKPTEYQVKAAYLYNFGLFVTWPATEKSPERPFEVCVLGKDPFGPSLDSAFAGEALDGRSVSIRRIASTRDALSCGILYISQPEAKDLDTILSDLSHAAILTVSDIPDFSRRGGMIQFVWEGNNVRFEVNLTAAKSAGLSLSSDLLKVATAVRRNTPDGM